MNYCKYFEQKLQIVESPLLLKLYLTSSRLTPSDVKTSGENRFSLLKCNFSAVRARALTFTLLCIYAFTH